ncbi:GTP-binding protein [Halonotius aquaticus]|uniref:Probable GTP-binding protein EngB n=1 Tax=Halonotius aquaticus TaxID=2216978 RepID=A0A3A6Q7Y1_9EURY|nr:GTP-binding protein EngB [Halonotius aquaticus]RJX41966.1 GTP-binding protein [Halonotius aquaticus]
MFEGRPDRDDEIVLVGRSNVGKSTIMRELTGHSVPTGQKPGVTREPNHFDWSGQSFMFTDLPGFGFMSGVEGEHREAIQTDIVHYIENNAESILAAVLVVDGKSVIDIIDRHSDRGEIPHDVEMYHFLEELGVPTVVAVNKMDKVDDKDERLNDLCDRLGLFPPWQQWDEEVIAPITAKAGRIDSLRTALQGHIRDAKRDELLQFVTA